MSIKEQPPQIHKVYWVAVAVGKPVFAVSYRVLGGEAGGLWGIIAVAVVVEGGGWVVLFAEIAKVGISGEAALCQSSKSVIAVGDFLTTGNVC